MMKTKANKKFDIDLKYGQIREDMVSSMFKDKKIEIKTAHSIRKNSLANFGLVFGIELFLQEKIY